MSVHRWWHRILADVLLTIYFYQYYMPAEPQSQPQVLACQVLYCVYVRAALKFDVYTVSFHSPRG